MAKLKKEEKKKEYDEQDNLISILIGRGKNVPPNATYEELTEILFESL